MAERSCPRAPRGGGDGRGSARHGGSGGGREERGGMAGGRGVARLPPLPLTPLSPGSAVPGAGPPRGRADTPGLLECRRCRYLRTGRACCQLVGALLAALILVCSSVSYGSAGGYTGVPDQGSIYYYMYGGAYSGLSGAEGEKAQQLDRRFTQLKVPIARAAMAVGGALMVFSSALIVVGVVRLPWRFPALLIVECILDAVVAVGLLFALYYFFHHLLGVYDSSVCKERAQLYQSKGYRGFSCSMHGAEIAAGLLGCAAVVAFLLGAGLAIRGYRIVHKLKQKPEHAYEP
ncbi:MARVEL domain-containing protein 3 [Gallus gallus]|uniref:MARVEL domain-containing protein 3 n=1 Tax=Gallus gallus TaxID=9031 RepID=UPI0000E80DED|nr:MARVEL domain-containing protein 3 [Gallus gallus]